MIEQEEEKILDVGRKRGWAGGEIGFWVLSSDRDLVKGGSFVGPAHFFWICPF